MDIADWYGPALRRRLRSADRLSEAAIARELPCLKTAGSSASALLRRVTSPDQWRRLAARPVRSLLAPARAFFGTDGPSAAPGPGPGRLAGGGRTLPGRPPARARAPLPGEGAPRRRAPAFAPERRGDRARAATGRPPGAPGLALPVRARRALARLLLSTPRRPQLHARAPGLRKADGDRLLG